VAVSNTLTVSVSFAAADFNNDAEKMEYMTRKCGESEFCCQHTDTSHQFMTFLIRNGQNPNWME